MIGDVKLEEKEQRKKDDHFLGAKIH